MTNEKAAKEKPKSKKPHLSLEYYLTSMGQGFILKRRSSLIRPSWEYLWQPIWQ